MHDVRDWLRNLSYNALRYQQEQVENAAQEHQREAMNMLKLQLFLLRTVQQLK